MGTTKRPTLTPKTVKILDSDTLGDDLLNIPQRHRQIFDTTKGDR